MEILAILLLVAPFAIAVGVWRNRRIQRDVRASTVELRVDEFGVRRRLADGREEGIDWSDIAEVEVYRTKTGPHGRAGGLVMLAGDATTGCLVPLDRLDEAVVGPLTRLPGFDVRLFQEALDAAPPNQLVVWRRGS